jgi:CRISPR-associated endonuclease/helicase Cas3
MLYSALTDADTLVSEAWDTGREREAEVATIPKLTERLDAKMAKEAQRRTSQGVQGSTTINRMRAEVLQRCLDAAQREIGQYTLTVPTGGGKTLSSLAFALHHACWRSLKRVIVVIPYTSIIEQTADVLRQYLGDENVVEHHSAVDLDKDTARNQRACENWDAPVIVTTSVQFFESLFAAHKGRCRKLHNIADSVIVLDEVQSFPVDLLSPIRQMLGLLSKHWNCTVLHCTATQPTPEAGRIIGPGMDPVPKPVIPDPAPLFSVVKNRIRIFPEGNLQQPLSMQELAERLRQFPTAMAIVHNRKEAEQLARLVDGAWHLSARMCAAHRKDVLDAVRAALKAGCPLRLISTQLIEAGVDVSFPVVFRALAGIETLAQAAGRCNRELDGEGEFHIFLAPSRPPSNSLRRGLAVTQEFLGYTDFELDLNDPSLFPRYFREVLGPAVQTDAPGISGYEHKLDFPAVEAAFRMIADDGQTVLAPYGDWKRLLANIRHKGPTRETLRAMQRHFVQLRNHEIDALLRLGLIEPLYQCAEPRTWAVREGAKVYDERFGFGWQAAANLEPDDLIV